MADEGPQRKLTEILHVGTWPSQPVPALPPCDGSIAHGQWAKAGLGKAREKSAAIPCGAGVGVPRCDSVPLACGHFPGFDVYRRHYLVYWVMVVDSLLCQNTTSVDLGMGVHDG